MVRKALAALASAAILLCVGIFDSAPADAQGLGAYRGLGGGYYRGPRGGVAVGAGYRGGARIGFYRGPRGGVAVRGGYYGGGYRTGYYGGRAYYGGRGYYGGGYRTGYYGGRGYYGCGCRTGYYGDDDSYTDVGYQTVGYGGGYRLRLRRRIWLRLRRRIWLSDRALKRRVDAKRPRLRLLRRLPTSAVVGLWTLLTIVDRGGPPCPGRRAAWKCRAVRDTGFKIQSGSGPRRDRANVAVQ